MPKPKKSNAVPKNAKLTQPLNRLFAKYKGKKHPLTFENPYQLLVKIILSSRTTDRLINDIAPEFFKQYPSIKSLPNTAQEELFPHLSKVTNFANKAKWIVSIAERVKDGKNIPITIEELTNLPGIGRKSANVFIALQDLKPEGVLVDLHVLRVAQRIGITKSTNPDIVERDLMATVPQRVWNKLRLALTFLGRRFADRLILNVRFVS